MDPYRKFHSAHVAYWLLSSNSHHYHKTSKLVYSPFLWSLLSLYIATQDASNKINRPENDQNHSPFSLTELFLETTFTFQIIQISFATCQRKKVYSTEKKRGKTGNYKEIYEERRKKEEERKHKSAIMEVWTP